MMLLRIKHNMMLLEVALQHPYLSNQTEQKLDRSPAAAQGATAAAAAHADVLPLTWQFMAHPTCEDKQAV
jgi:hypothetical protein